MRSNAYNSSALISDCVLYTLFTLYKLFCASRDGTIRFIFSLYVYCTATDDLAPARLCTSSISTQSHVFFRFPVFVIFPSLLSSCSHSPPPAHVVLSLVYYRSSELAFWYHISLQQFELFSEYALSQITSKHTEYCSVFLINFS